MNCKKTATGLSYNHLQLDLQLWFYEVQVYDQLQFIKF